MILVDTSVWIDHFYRTNEPLMDLLLSSRVCIHPFVLGELACGNITNRKEILSLLRALPNINVALDEEVYKLIEDKKLFGKGLGFIDIHLMASALIHHVPILTRDKSLKQVASEMGITYHI